MENILDQAKKVAEEAEVFVVSSEETPVHFEANRLKSIQSKHSSSVALRIIKNGRIGYAAASGVVDAERLVSDAVETAQFGMTARFEFPSSTTYPKIEVLDSATGDVSVENMVELGRKMISAVTAHTPEIVCDAGAGRSVVSISIMNSRGGQARYRKTTFGLGISGTLISGTDMLFVGEGQESCHPLSDTKSVTDVVIHQLELARSRAAVPSGELPVILTPDGVASAIIPSLMAAFNGKLVLEGASPIGDRLGQPVFDKKFSMWDDPTIAFRPHSRPCDDEGVPSQQTALVREGTVASFLYDLQTAGLAKARSTGNGNRVRGGIVAPSPSAFIIAAGEASFDEMVQDIKEGLVVEQLMGAEQGNILGGDFSGNVLLGFKVESGKIVGRVKDTMVSGNVYQALKDIGAMGKEAKWVGGALHIPAIYIPRLSVASR